MNKTTIIFFPDIMDWTDIELVGGWDHLEKLKLNDFIEAQMNEIHNEISRRQGRNEWTIDFKKG